MIEKNATPVTECVVVGQETRPQVTAAFLRPEISMRDRSSLTFFHVRRALPRLAALTGVGLAALVAAPGCSTGELSLGQNAISGTDGGAARQTCVAAGGSCTGLGPSSCSGGHFADANQVTCGDGVGVGCCIKDGSCRAIPPLDPSVCALDETIVSHTDPNGCWLGFDCVPKDQDGGPAPDASGPPCPSGRGQCVGISPSSCNDGVFAPNEVASCGGGVGVGCCVSCPQIVAPVCPPDRQTVKSDKDIYGCTVGAFCIKTFTLGDADSGASIAAKVHDGLQVTLSQNASTGYLWTVSQGGGLPAPTKTTVPGTNPGESGTDTFAWDDLSAGTHAVSLIYKRPFETTPIITYTFTVTVTP